MNRVRGSVFEILLAIEAGVAGFGAMIVVILPIKGNGEGSYCAIGRTELDLHPA